MQRLDRLNRTLPLPALCIALLAACGDDSTATATASEPGVDGQDGQDGKNGNDGQDGNDGQPGEEIAPAGEIDLTDACRVLDEWDGHFDPDSEGAPLWREFLNGFGDESIWANGFDPAKPLETPNGLVESGADGDPVLINLASDEYARSVHVDSRPEGQRVARRAANGWTGR